MIDPATPQFDPRASVVQYLEEQADRLTRQRRGEEAALVRGLASSVAAQLDVEPGRRGIADELDALLLRVGAQYDLTLTELKGEARGGVDVVLARSLGMWLARRRLGWSEGRVASFFAREIATVQNAVTRVETQRHKDDDFRCLADALLIEPVYCPHCLKSLSHHELRG